MKLHETMFLRVIWTCVLRRSDGAGMDPVACLTRETAGKAVCG